MTEARHTIAGGFLDGGLLRSRRRGRAQIAHPARPDKWTPAPLNALARRYLTDDPVWVWLREQGVKRPTRASGEHNNATRTAVLLRLDSAVVERAKARAGETGRDLRTVVEDALRREVG